MLLIMQYLEKNDDDEHINNINVVAMIVTCDIVREVFIQVFLYMTRPEKKELLGLDGVCIVRTLLVYVKNNTNI